jgi:sugar-specific transcriptional regulator TrmB
MSSISTKLPELSTEQSKVYLSALELGSDTVQHIAKKAGLPRSTTYLFIDDLKSKGLLSQTKRGNKTLIIAEPPAKLVELAQQKLVVSHEALKKIQQTLPELQAIHNTRQNKPIVRYFEGFVGIKTILEESLKAREILILCSGYQEPLDEQITNFLNNDYFPSTSQKGIKIREIITKHPEWKKYVDKFNDEDHQIKVSDQIPMDNHIDKLIFADIVTILSYTALNGIVIQHAYIAAYEKILFDQMWNNLK